MYNKKKICTILSSNLLICINLQNKIKLKNIGRSSRKKFFGFGLELVSGDSMAAISRAEERERERVSFAAEKRGTRSQWETGNLLGPIWLLGGEEKNSFRTQGFHLSRVKSGTMSAATSAKTLLPLPSDPTLYFHLLFLFTLFFARWLKHPSHSLFPWLPLQPEKTSWQRNYALYVVSLRLVARFFHSFPFLARRGEGGDRSRRILSTPAAWLCAVKLYQRARN